MSAPQSFKSHARFDPPFHFVVLPALLLNLIFSIYSIIHHWPDDPRVHIWWIVMAIVLILLAGSCRGAALKVQDRVIRLEERLRLASILPQAQHEKIALLSTDQLIGLRFASDQEVGALALKALDQNLNRKAIKQSIVTWRPDYDRA